MLARWRAQWWHSSGRGGPDALGLVFTLLHGHVSMPEDAASSTCVDQAEHRDNLHTGRARRGNAGPKSQGGRCQPRPQSPSPARAQELQRSPEPSFGKDSGAKVFGAGLLLGDAHHGLYRDTVHPEVPEPGDAAHGL